MTDTWFSESDDDSLFQVGYGLYRTDRIGRTGGGVCMYVRNCFLCTDINRYVGPNAIEFLSLRSFELNLFVLCTYISPNLRSADSSEIMEFFIETLDAELLVYPHSNVLI